MKKPVLILLVMVAVAAAAYFSSYRIATHETRQMLTAADGSAWLRAEFALNDEQARAIAALQADYEPRCMKMCERIVEANKRLDKLVRESKAITPELEAALREVSQTQADCRAATLTQAFAISAHMAPEQAVRYRVMMKSHIFEPVAGHQAVISEFAK